MIKKRLAIFASGAGSNAAEIINHFKDSLTAEVALVICNKPGAGVLDIAEKAGIAFFVVSNDDFKSLGCLEILKNQGIDFIVLAGFLRKIPLTLINAYPKKIVNIHPALLPKYGGKGMYGNHVHTAVIRNGETESGITIHYVDEIYDHGDIIYQATCAVTPADTPESLAKKIHALEHAHYAKVIEGLLT